jgi:beta-mannosidase
MPPPISLNGDWQFKEYYGEDWRSRNAHKATTRDTRLWRAGTVPGSVHHDLWSLGEIPNPYFERNSLLLEWIPARTWLYKKTFFISEALRGKRIQLRHDSLLLRVERR